MPKSEDEPKRDSLIGKNELLESHAFVGRYGGRPEVCLHAKIQLDFRGQFACALLEKWGLVLGQTGPEDSAGRATVAPLPPKEVVARAFDTADAAYKEILARGWYVELPSFAEIQEKAVEHN